MIKDVDSALAVERDLEVVVAVLFAHSDTGGREDIDRSAPPCGRESEVIDAELIFLVAVEVFGRSGGVFDHLVKGPLAVLDELIGIFPAILVKCGAVEIEALSRSEV